MNHPCSIVVLESALAGNLPAEEESSLHRHLEECAECSAALERMAGGKPWCEEAASLLARDQLDEGVPTREEWSAVDFTVEHLEPSDEPNVLGRLGGGAYDVLEVVGHGSMGVVLKAFDRELKRCVAIKVLAPHFAHSPLAKKRFAREAQAAAAVVHPQVLAIHQVQPAGPLPFLVMPFVVGESLAQRLANQGTLELREILRIGTQVAAGLAAAHEQGLVHRDVKPANILLEKGVERAVLSDFGLARAADDVALTRWGVVAGTPQYMSPEQARGDALDGRSDLFSLGCVLYEMATGVSPFRADTMIATIRRLVEESPQAMGSLNPELPPWFIAIVGRLLEKEPSRRFGSAKEVSELLEGCLAHIQQPASVPLPSALPRSVVRGGWRSLSRLKGVPAMIAVLGLGLWGVLLLSETPSDIAGDWSSEEFGNVVLKKSSGTEYTGTYSETIGKQPGEIRLKWSRIERQFNGTWREGDDRFGELSVRLVGDEIRGALTTDSKSKINPGTPRLAGFSWTKGGKGQPAVVAKPPAAAAKLAFGPVVERVLPYSAPCLQQYFQFRKGEVLVVGNGPSTTDEQFEEDRKKVEEAGGADISLGSNVGIQLVGEGCIFSQDFENLKWDTFTAEKAVNGMKRVNFSFGVVEPAVKDLPVTYLFKTAQGDVGIMEILALVDDERGIGGKGMKFRYKLVKTAETPRDADGAGGKSRAQPTAREEGDESEAKDHPDSLTPQQVVEKGQELSNSRKKVAVRLQITGGKIRTVINEKGDKHDEWALQAAGSDDFSIHFTPQGEAAFRQNGIKDVRAHYLGKAIEVEGTVSAVGLDLIGRPETLWTYHIDVNSLDQIRLLGPVDGSRGRAAARTERQRLTPSEKSPAALANETTQAAGKAAATANAVPKLIRQIQTAHRIKAIACSADGKLIAVSNGEVIFPATPDSKQTVTILDAETGKTVISLPLTTKEEDAVLAATEGLPHYEVGPIAFSPEGNVVAVGTGLGQVKLFNARTGELIRALDDEKEKLAEKKTPEKLKTLKRAMGAVSALAFSPDGNLLAMCGSSFDDIGQNWGGIERLRLFTTGPGRLKVWEVKTGTLKFNLAGHSDADAIAFAPEGNYLASAGRWSGPDHGTGVIVWNLENGTKVRTLVKEANGGVRAVAFSPTRKIVAMAALNFDKENDTRSTSVSLAFALSGITEWQQTIPGWANPKAFLPDGKTVIVQCGEESIRFVNTETGVVRHEIKSTDHPPGGRWSDVAIALKGNRLMIAGTDGAQKGFVAVWELGGASPGE